MTFGTPNGSQASQSESPPSRLSNGEIATYFNVGFAQAVQALAEFQENERRRTPSPTQPSGAARPLSWRARCEALWASLPDEESLDEGRRQIKSAWYQFLVAFANFRLLAEKLGYGGVSPGLLDDEKSSSEELYTFWRQVADGTSRILERAGASREEVREHLQETPVDELWEMEYRFLEPLAAAEEQKHHDNMTEHVRRPAQSSQQESSPRPQTSLQGRQERRPARVQKPARTGKIGKKPAQPRQQRPPPEQRKQPKKKTQRDAAPKAASGGVTDSMSTGPTVGNSFASTSAASKTSRIMSGLDTDDILNSSRRSLRTRRGTNAGQNAAGTQDGRTRTRVIGGRVDTKKCRKPPRTRRQTASSDTRVS